MSFALWHIVLAVSSAFLIGFIIGVWWANTEPRWAEEEAKSKTCRMFMKGEI